MSLFLRECLSPPCTPTGKSVCVDTSKYYSCVYFQVDTVVNPLKKTVSSVGNMVKSMPDNIVDGVVKVSGGIRNIPSNMLDGMGKMLSNKQVLLQFSSHTIRVSKSNVIAVTWAVVAATSTPQHSSGLCIGSWFLCHSQHHDSSNHFARQHGFSFSRFLGRAGESGAADRVTLPSWQFSRSWTEPPSPSKYSAAWTAQGLDADKHPVSENLSFSNFVKSFTERTTATDVSSLTLSDTDFCSSASGFILFSIAESGRCDSTAHKG